MRFLLVIILSLLIAKVTFSQSQISFTFLPKDHTLSNDEEYFLYDSLITKRKVISSTEFMEIGILCADFSKDCSARFRIDKNRNWDVFFQKKWQRFYNALSNKLQIINIKSNEVQIEPVLNKEIADGKYALLCYRLSNLKHIEPDNNTLYWFHPDFGVVVIERNSTFFVRKDFSEFMDK